MSLHKKKKEEQMTVKRVLLANVKKKALVATLWNFFFNLCLKLTLINFFSNFFFPRTAGEDFNCESLGLAI